MEVEALAGAEATLKRHKPQLFIEWKKSDCDAIVAVLKRLGYKYAVVGGDIVAIHEADRAGADIIVSDKIMRLQTPGSPSNASAHGIGAAGQTRWN